MSTEKRLNARLIQKHDVEANWITASNNGFVPLKGEIIFYDRDSNYNYERMKIGDGTTKVHELPFVGENSGGSNVIPGEFLEFGEDGKLNVVPSYTTSGGETLTETFHCDASTDWFFGDNAYSKTYYLSHKVDSIVSWNMTDDGDGNNGMVLRVSQDNGVYFFGYPFDDYNGDGNDITVTYVSKTEEKRLTPAAGDFLEEVDGKFNVVTEYDYPSGTITEVGDGVHLQYDDFKVTINTKYPIGEVISFEYSSDNGSGSTTGYEISDDRKSISYTYGPCGRLSALVTYSYEAGTRYLVSGGGNANINSGPTLPETGSEGEIFLQTSMVGQQYTETITISTTGIYSLTYPIASIVSANYSPDQYPQFSIKDGLLVIDGDWYYSDDLTITYIVGEATGGGIGGEYPKTISCNITTYGNDISNVLVKGVDNGSMITLYLDYDLSNSGQDEEGFTFGAEYANKALLGVYCLTPSGPTIDSSMIEITPGQPLSQGFYFYQSPTRISGSKAVVIIYYV